MSIQDERKAIGLRVKQAREALGINQEDLAQALGYKNKAAVSKIERGVNDIPRPRILAFAEALQTTPEFLLGWSEDEPIPADDLRDRRKEEHGGLFKLLDKATPEQLDAVENLLKTMIPDDDPDDWGAG